MADKTLRLLYDDYPQDETILRLSPIPTRRYFEIVERNFAIGPESTAEQITGFVRDFADLTLVSWSFPEPANADGFMERDYVFQRACIRDWITSMREVDLPLLLGSSGTTPSPAGQTRRSSSNGRRRSTRGSRSTPVTP